MRLGGGRSRGRADPTEGGGRGASPGAARLLPGRPRELGPQPGFPQPDPTQPECGGIGAGVAASDRGSLSEDHRASPGGRQGEGTRGSRSGEAQLVTAPWGVPALSRPHWAARLLQCHPSRSCHRGRGPPYILAVAVAQTPTSYRSPAPPSAVQRRGVRGQPQWMRAQCRGGSSAVCCRV